MNRTLLSTAANPVQSVPGDDAADPWNYAESGSGNDSDHWLLGYVDILTLMLTLVVLLLAFERIENSAAAGSRKTTPHNTGTAAHRSVQTAATESSPAKHPDPVATRNQTATEPAGPALLLARFNHRAAERITKAAPPPEFTDIWNTADENPAILTANDAAEETLPLEIQAMAVPEGHLLIQVDPLNILFPEPRTGIAQPTPEASESITRNASTWKELEDYRQKIAETGMSRFIDITSDHNAIRMEVREDILFETGSAELRHQGMLLISELAGVFRGQAGEIHVEGHTDNIPISTGRFPSNWELSAGRAGSVARHLVELEIDQERIRTIGFADTRPRSSNETEEGRSSNRRVSLVVALDQAGADGSR